MLDEGQDTRIQASGPQYAEQRITQERKCSAHATCLHTTSTLACCAGGGLRVSGSFIVMEYLNLGGRCDQAALGRQLALMHLAEPAHGEARAGGFGFPVANTIGCVYVGVGGGGIDCVFMVRVHLYVHVELLQGGSDEGIRCDARHAHLSPHVGCRVGLKSPSSSPECLLCCAVLCCCRGTPQPNPWCNDWVTFFREHRLMHQLRLAGDAKLLRMGETLAGSLDRLFEGVEVKPAGVLEL
jgi:hypothetical protein